MPDKNMIQSHFIHSSLVVQGYVIFPLTVILFSVMKRLYTVTTKKQTKIIEISVCDFESYLASLQGGANSIELCSNLTDGGITSSLGFAEKCIEALDAGAQIKLHVLIRPRAGDFCYSDEDFSIIIKDIEHFKSIGIHGIVVGILDENRDVDMVRMSIIRDYCRGMTLTFHRAFDVCRDPQKGLEDIISLQCDRLLTSGQQSSAFLGQSLLRQLVMQADGRISIIAAAGVNEGNVQSIISGTCVDGVHAASAVIQRRPSVSVHSSSNISARMGRNVPSIESDTDSWTVVFADKVAAFRLAAEQGFSESCVREPCADGKENIARWS